MSKLIFKSLIVLGISGISVMSCNQENLTSKNSGTSATLLAVSQTSSQLASGTTFSVQTTSTGASIDTTQAPPSHHGHCKNDGMGTFLNGTNFLTPTIELVAIVDAESAGDMRGFRMFEHGGATVTNYDANGNVVSLPVPAKGGPEGVSFSGGQFPQMDSVLSKIVKTVVDFGTGVTVKHDSTSITRSGKIVITRTKSGTTRTETISFENYAVNGNAIEGTKTRVSTFDSSTGQGTSTTSVSNGKIIFSDGTVASWVSDKSRTTSITIDATTKRPTSGTIVTTASTKVTATDGTVIYSHITTKPLTENVACGEFHHWPVSGTIETVYRTHDVIVDFGSGSCTSRTVTITIDGTTTTKTIGG
jgi:hypothetical protein